MAVFSVFLRLYFRKSFQHAKQHIVTMLKIVQKFGLISVVAAAICISLHSCGKKEPVVETDETVPVENLIPRKDITLTRTEADYVKANNSFALELFKKASSSEGGKSMLLSPLSVTFALGMVNNGAVGQTKYEIDKTLGFGEDTGSMNEFCSKMLSESAKVDPSTTIEIANASVVNSMYSKLKDRFTEAVEDNYEANVCYKDFSKDDVKGLINNWCSEKTHGMIPELLKDQVTILEYAHFLNATYFKGIWSSQFKKSDSKKEKFYLEDGSKRETNMMHQKARFNYGYLPNIGPALCLPYGNQAFRMVIILPDEGKKLEDVKQALDLNHWETMISNMYGVEVDVKLPSFESEYNTDLVDVLREMGIEKAFSGKDADFSEMTESPVYISKVIHKAKIKVDEQGSEAAAVTDVVMGYTSPGPGSTVQFQFHADRPFIYAITEVSTGAIFFIGQYTGK